MRHVPAIEVASDRLPRAADNELAHIPGPRGHWYFGNLRQLLPDPIPFLIETRAEYGDCFTVGLLRNRRIVVLAGPAANRHVLLDADGNFSSRLGWEVALDFFSGFVLLRDFEDHAFHRGLLRPFFKPDALRSDLVCMNRMIATEVAGLAGSSDAYRLAKRLALDIGLAVFGGFASARSDDTIYLDTVRVLDGAMARRSKLPGSRYWRAVRARDRLRDHLLAEVPRRRGGDGHDLFSRLSRYTDSKGRQLCDQDIVDHVFGMLFAAHETTASAMALMMYSLARHPEWQAQARRDRRPESRRATHVGGIVRPADHRSAVPRDAAALRASPVPAPPQRSALRLVWPSHPGQHPHHFATPALSPRCCVVRGSEFLPPGTLSRWLGASGC